MSSKTPHFYEFGPFKLDPSTPFLLRDDQPVSLTVKALETLTVLVERSGRVVSRDELIEAVWPDVAVEENNLSVNISFLRKALGETPEGKKYIETVPRRGYRFVAPVRVVPIESLEITYSKQTSSTVLVEETSETDAVLDIKPVATTTQAIVTPVSSNSRLRNLARWPVLFAVIAGIAVLAAGASLISRRWQRNGESAPARKAVASDLAVRSLAVLPFKAGSNLINFGLYNGGEHEELTNAVVERMSATGKLNITPQEALLAEKATPHNVLLVGHKLNVDAVLTGAIFQNDAEVMRLRLHLISVNGGEVLWADTVGYSPKDLPALADSVTRNVLAGLHRLRSAEEYERRATRHTANRDAYQHYLQGRFLWEQRDDVFAPNFIAQTEGMTASTNQLEQARLLDPNFALAYLGLADHYKTSDYKEGEWRRGEEYALKALALDPNLAEAHATLAFIRMFHYWDWAGAEVEFKRALELDPDCVTAHQWYALFHALHGNNGESTKEITRARELAPFSIVVAVNAAEMLYYHAGSVSTGSYNNAIYPSIRILELHREASRAEIVLSQAYWMHNENRDREKAVAVATNGTWKGSPEDYARWRAGPRKGSREFDNMPRQDTFHCAQWSAVLDRREEALDLLERAYDEHHFFVIYIKAEPFFTNLRDEPRYQDLLRRLNLL